jgi:hypothetical protein
MIASVCCSVGGWQEVVVLDDPVEAVLPDHEIHDELATQA